MQRELRVLLLEDVRADAELVERELHRSEIPFSLERVATREDFLESLERLRPNLILADYALPSFDGMAALSLAKDSYPDVPFIFVSGAIGEERAIEALKKGATDYVLKQRLSRLGPVVRRVVREAEERRAREQAEERVRRSERRHRLLLETNNAIIVNLDRQSLFDAIARALEKVFHFDRASITLHDPVKDVIRVYALEGVGSQKPILAVGTEFPRKGSHLEDVLGEKRQHLRQDLEKEPLIGLEARLLEEGIRSYVSVPLMVKGKPIGSLNLGSRAPHGYSEEDGNVLLDVGTQVALALENTRAYEEIARLKSRLEQENVYLQEELKLQNSFPDTVGESPAIKKVLQAVERVAPTDTTVLVTGETGTGKERVAHAVHDLSARKDRPLVKVNCAALPAGLIESELFGHEKGAFTGALSRKIGRFELAHGGTLFLDEIGDLPLELQAKLLHVLQNGEFERVGSSKTLRVDVRVIAATNQDLEEAIAGGTFRADLYYRLNVFPISIPPLRERREDIPLLVSYFLMKLDKRAMAVSRESLDLLTAYPWPGNVRELENIVERAAILSRGDRLELGEWPPRTAASSGGGRVPTLDELDREHIQSVLDLTRWQVSGQRGAAKLLGMKPSTLRARMQKLGIERKR